MGNKAVRLDIWRLVLFVVLAVCALLVLPTRAWADDGSRAIGVVFDNSGSMLYEGSDDAVSGASDKWCNARYGLEAVAGMMDSQDTMTVYCMDEDASKLTLGPGTTAAQRVQAVHDADLGISFHTEAYTVRHALDGLEASSASERYLFITTDGAFDSVGYVDDASAPQRVNEYIQEAADQGITVVYLAIGENATTIDSDPSRGIYAFQADSSSILSKMTDIANQMFNRATVPHDDYDVDAGTIELEVPMGKIVVFAQGGDVSVGSLSGGGVTVDPDIASMSYTDTPTAGGAATVEAILKNLNIDLDVNTSLHGQIAVYDAQLASGSYQLDITGAESTEIYYEPYADVAVTLTNPLGETVTLDADSVNELQATTYTVDYRLLDPFTHEELDSPLLGEPSYSLQVYNAGTDQTVAEGDSFELEYDPSGETTFTATATLIDGVQAQQTYSANVNGVLGVLDVDGSSLPSSVSIDALDGAGGIVHVTHDDGSELTEEEWAETSLQASNDAGLPITVEKLDTVGDFRVSAGYIDGDLETTYDRMGFGPASILSVLPGLGSRFQRDTSTTITARINNDAAPFGGRTEVGMAVRPSLALVLAHWWWLYLLILLLLWLVWRIVTKPRLPKGMGAYLTYGINDSIKLQCKKKSPLLRADSMTVRLRRDDAFNAEDLGQAIGWRGGSGSLVVRAVKPRGGSRSFRFSKESLQAVNANRPETMGPLNDPEMAMGYSFEFQGKSLERDTFAGSEWAKYSIEFRKA